MISTRMALTVLAATLTFGAAANATVTISSRQTQNMNCSGGVCSPTATKAVLNVGDLQNMLASGNVEVITTASGVEASDIELATALAWSSGATLTLDAYQSVAINKPLSVNGTGGLALATNDGGAGGVLSFGAKGHAKFANLSSPLSINGIAYTLVHGVKSLATAIANNPSGAFALASNYDAGPDGTYDRSPVTTVFLGRLEGLGNTISNLSLQGTRRPNLLGLFSELYTSGIIDDLKLTNLSASAQLPSFAIGGLVGQNYGTLMFDSVSGSVTTAANRSSSIGGLVGDHYGGLVSNCHASVSISVGAAEKYLSTGGLVGYMDAGTIDSSYATGSVTAGNGNVGGLAGSIAGSASGPSVTNSYATGAVSVTGDGLAGGFAGDVYEATVATSYSTGSATSGGSKSYVGGFAGLIGDSSVNNSYWDTTTSGTDQGTGTGNVSGVAGLTTAQFQSGLPSGFDPAIWNEKSKIDNGFPYLLSNSPVK